MATTKNKVYKLSGLELSDIDADFQAIKQSFNHITQVYIENGQKCIRILNRLGKAKFNQWLKERFPQEALIIRKQMLVAQFLADNSQYEKVIKGLTFEFLCILAKAPNNVSRDVLTSKRNNWTIAELKQLIKEYKQKLKEEISADQIDNHEDNDAKNKKPSYRELRIMNNDLLEKNRIFQDLITKLNVTQEKLIDQNQLLFENNQLLKTMINRIKEEPSFINYLDQTPDQVFNYPNFELYDQV